MEPTPLAPGQLDKITLAELLGALSHALDLTEGQPAGHCVRCSRIGVEIGREIGLGEDEIAELYYALLLKDLGCSSNAARICELYLPTISPSNRTSSSSTAACRRRCASCSVIPG